MNATRSRDLDRLTELLADEASAALDSADTQELKTLLERNPRAERYELMQVAGLAQVAFLRREQRVRRTGNHMPPGLKERLVSHGEAVAIRQRGPSSVKPGVPSPHPPSAIRKIDEATGRTGQAGPRPTRSGSLLGGLGWALAAALAVALVVVRTDAPLEPDAIAARTSLVNAAPDVITLPWAPPTAEGYRTVRGDVVWSQSRQQGYLRLANMPVNDQARTQYQLWIVDPDRDSKHPVDGGVFNVSATGEVIIPIQAKLPIRSPRAFAITAEQPGGVVVSAGPLLVVASI